MSKGSGTSRSYEGSLGVLIVTLVTLFIAIAISPGLHFNFRTAFALPFIALACAITEGISPHGWDNTSMQLVPTLLVAMPLTR